MNAQRLYKPNIYVIYSNTIVSVLKCHIFRKLWIYIKKDIDRIL